MGSVRRIKRQIRKIADEANERVANRTTWPTDAVFQASYRERMLALERQLREAESEIRDPCADVPTQAERRTELPSRSANPGPPRETMRQRWERDREADFDSCLYPGGSKHGRFPR